MRARKREERPAPREGRTGKDAPWVPTPPALVESMLDLAGVGCDDYLIDLGSGDGRIVIAAARRGARALGVEYDAEMVVIARRAAERAGVSERATFIRTDMYDADISGATVIALFLLPDNLRKLEPKLRGVAAGARVVTNRFAIEGWTPARVTRIGGTTDDCCTALLYIGGASSRDTAVSM
jgi:hypothetical protein